LEEEVVELVFHGLDTFSEVNLNGRVILQADNMFRTWVADAKEALRPGENELEIRFASPLPPALAARASLPYPLPAGNDRGDPPSRVFVRKAAYHYGWDWGPRFVTSGIWRPVELVAWSGARLTDLYFVTDSLADGEAFLTAVAEIQIPAEEAVRSPDGPSLPISLTLSSQDGAFDPIHHETVAPAGTSRVELPIRVHDPLLWWSNGLGDPHLYSARAELGRGSATDSRSTRFGIRTVEFVTDADAIGESFFFRLNGVPVFIKGANVIPLDHFSPRVTEEDYRRLFADVVDANMNMLRVWGGGIYEEDVFYDLADESGVLIWQDFMFANGMYPGDATFLESVRAEATDQVRRLRNHPSLALWCGNNEMDEGWHRWGWARAYESPEDSAAVWDTYQTIFHDLLPGVVAEEDPDRRYWPSSPSLGWGDPESMNRGDSHYWGVWHGQEPFEVFLEKLPRFSSEFGFQGFPAIETVGAFADSGDWNLAHPTLLVHQKHPIGNQIITTYMARDYPVPETFTDFVYVSQLLQARGMRMAFEAQRRAMPRTMGTLYWQLNDTWPVVSWSSRDYFGTWKALHYAARDAFAPLLLSPFLKGDTVEVWGVSDNPLPLDASLRLQLRTFSGEAVRDSVESVSLEANGATLLWKGIASELLGEADSRRTVLRVSLEVKEDAATVQEALLYFHPPRELDLEAPIIRLSAGVSDDGIALTLETDVLAKDVYLRLDGARFSDNFFDLLPEQVRSVVVETTLSPEEVQSRLSIKTLAEIPKEGVAVSGSSPGG
jgi:beta-mannosidase